MQEAYNAPLLVHGGRRLSWSDYGAIITAIGGRGLGYFGFLFVILTVPLAGICLLGLTVNMDIPDREWAIILLLLGAAVLLGLTASLLMHTGSRRQQRREHARMDMQSSEGTVISFYHDRVEQHTSQASFIMPYAEISRIVETDRLLAICNLVNLAIVLRAEDLAPQEADMLRALMLSRIAPGKWRRRRILRPLQPVPLPPPAFDTADEVLVEAYSGPVILRMANLLPAAMGMPPFFIAMAILMGMLLTQEEARFAQSYILDALIVAGILLGGMLLLFAVLAAVIAGGARSSLRRASPGMADQRLLVTRRGLVLAAPASTVLMRWDQIRVQMKTRRLVVRHGGEDPFVLFTLSWKAIKNAAVVRELIKQHAVLKG